MHAHSLQVAVHRPPHQPISRGSDRPTAAEMQIWQHRDLPVKYPPLKNIMMRAPPSVPLRYLSGYKYCN
jgi:hypothetical protein